MRQDLFLELSEDGKTLIRCRKDYKGTVVIPDGVTKIEAYAFAGCSGITSIEIPDSVKSIGFDAFYRCPVLVLNVGRSSYAEQYCKVEELEYSYTEADS